MEHYLSVIAEKTGSLIATAGRYGGMFSGCTPEQTAALQRFGNLWTDKCEQINSHTFKLSPSRFCGRRLCHRGFLGCRWCFRYLGGLRLSRRFCRCRRSTSRADLTRLMAGLAF